MIVNGESINWEPGDRVCMASRYGYLPFTGTVVESPVEYYTEGILKGLRIARLGTYVKMDNGSFEWYWSCELEVENASPTDVEKRTQESE